MLDCERIIENKFNECVSASDTLMHDNCDEDKKGCYYDDGGYKHKSYTHKEYCFMEFSNDYEQVLARQCENKRKDECLKLAHILINTYHLDYAQDSYAKSFLYACNGNECYEIAEILGLSKKNITTSTRESV